MRVCGVVAEYNPFHNGHKYQIDKIRQIGFDGIVAVMSGNAVQRGELAIAEKHIRTKQALLNGVDLVIELPLPFAVSSAERFALGGVSILDYLGVVNSICFGSECGDIEKLKAIADYNVEGSISNYLSEGTTYAAAVSNLIENELGKEYSDILAEPNNVLGIEYLKALKNLKSKMSAFTIKREGALHSDTTAGEGFCSAQYLRDHIESDEISQYMPQSSYDLLKSAIEIGEAPVRLENNQAVVLSALRVKDAEFFSQLQNISEGIENRLNSAARNACSLEELYSLVKTKRYTMTRVKRLVLNAFFGITNEYSLSYPPYIRVLGFNEKGREILRNAKLTSSKPICTLYSNFESLDELSKMYYLLECKATDLYYCFTPEIGPCGIEQTEDAVIIK